jgi:hypothetical protein
MMIVFGTAFGQPANDECTGATVIPDIPYMDNVDTTTATSNPDDPSLSCNGNGAQTDGNTVWYQWTPAEDIAVNISTVGSTQNGGELDTAHGVFTGSCEALTEVACVDIGLTDDLVFEATAGETYYIKFGEFLDGTGGGNLVVTVDLPPPPELIVLESVADGMSPPIRDLVANTLTGAEAGAAGVLATHEVPMLMRDGGRASGCCGQKIKASSPSESRGPDGLQSSRRDSKIDLLQIFDGIENDDNGNIEGFLLAPPDTDGDVGPNHYMQMTNVVTEIFDKSGNTVLGPFPGNVFWTGLGGLCEDTNRGDVIVLYDEERDSWFVSQFAFDNAFTQFSLCIAVSTTGDPTGSYYQHDFDFTAIGFPDYPKYGFVTDGIGVMANLFTPPFFGFGGTGLGVIDKTEAFTAGPATMILFQLGASEFGFLPGDNDGPLFDNMPPTFFTNNGGSGDRIDVWEITPDFAVPSNSTIAEVAKLPVPPFDSDICPASREECIDQPGSGANNIPFLEAIADRLMHRLQLRDFGQEKWAVVNHTVDADGNGKAGVRWYEFRNHKDRGWRLNKAGTFSPDGDHRWMGSVAMNAKGETCLGYSISSSTTYPSIGVAGRRGRSAILNRGELVVFDGNVDQFVQRDTARWGDYSAMSIDPVDDTCWYTQEHARPNSFIGEDFGWATKIVQFDLR